MTDDRESRADRSETDEKDASESADDIDDPLAELEGSVDEGPPDGSLSGSPPDSGSDREESDGFEQDAFAELGREMELETEDAIEDAFEQMDVGDVGDDDVWEALDEDAADSFGPAAGPDADEVSAASRATATSSVDDGVEHIVNKRSYCQQCPHFTAPPDVACTHEGTTIAEVVGFGEFRVRNCPMVSDDDPAVTDRHQQN